MVESDVWKLAERSGVKLKLVSCSGCGEVYMSAITASELLVGVEHASTAQSRALRGAFVENVLSIITVLEFSMFVARTHVRILAALSNDLIAGAHDAVIAATAIDYRYAVLTRNTADFKMFAGLKVETFHL